MVGWVGGWLDVWVGGWLDKIHQSQVFGNCNISSSIFTDAQFRLEHLKIAYYTFIHYKHYGRIEEFYHSDGRTLYALIPVFSEA